MTFKEMARLPAEPVGPQAPLVAAALCWAGDWFRSIVLAVDSLLNGKISRSSPSLIHEHTGYTQRFRIFHDLPSSYTIIIYYHPMFVGFIIPILERGVLVHLLYHRIPNKLLMGWTTEDCQEVARLAAEPMATPRRVEQEIGGFLARGRVAIWTSKTGVLNGHFRNLNWRYPKNQPVM